MTAAQGLDDRNLVPRWRPFRESTKLGELASLGTERQTPHFPVPSSEALDKFRALPGLHTAADALGLASSLKDLTLLTPVIAFIEESDEANGILRAAALSVRHRMEQKESAKEVRPDWTDLKERDAAVRMLRGELRFFPRNPTKWVDLALAQTLLGDVQKAERSLLTAITLAPANRFVLRSAVRFFLHVDDPERARHVLLNVRGSADPWILAAELATDEAAGRSPRSMRQALQALNSNDFGPWALSELACTVAHAEFNEGRDKRGRKILAQATLEPTENAAAQIEFESQRGGFTAPKPVLTPEGSFEAKALEASNRQDWISAIDAGQKWQMDQPFAVEPAMFLSYVAAVGAEDYSAAEQAARIGRVANPKDPMLANNLVFALANQNKFHEAADILVGLPAPRDPREAAVHEATRGLIAFRSGEHEKGRALYGHAMRESLRLDLPGQAALAASYWAREECRVVSSEAAEVFKQANQLAELTSKRDAQLILSRIPVNLTGEPAPKTIAE